MSVNAIKISTTRLNGDAQTVQEQIQTISREMESMQESVAALNAMWSGPGHSAFVRAFQKDMEALGQLVKELEELQAFEVYAGEQYETCEKQVADLVSSIRV